MCMKPRVNFLCFTEGLFTPRFSPCCSPRCCWCTAGCTPPLFNTCINEKSALDVHYVAHHPNHEYIMIAHREGLPRGYTSGLYSYRMHRRFACTDVFDIRFQINPPKPFVYCELRSPLPRWGTLARAQRLARAMNDAGSVELSYNGEPIMLKIIKNGFNACRHRQFCIKVKCNSPSRSKTLISSVSQELLAEIVGRARAVQGLRGKEGPLAAGSSLWRALKAICVEALARRSHDCQAAPPAPSPGAQPSRKGGTKEGVAIASAYGTGWKGANLQELKTRGFQVVRASKLEELGLSAEDRAALARFVARNMSGSLPTVHEPKGQETLCATSCAAQYLSTSVAHAHPCALLLLAAQISPVRVPRREAQGAGRKVQRGQSPDERRGR